LKTINATGSAVFATCEFASLHLRETIVFNPCPVTDEIENMEGEDATTKIATAGMATDATGNDNVTMQERIEDKESCSMI
jgi:hypothetical protein